MYTREFTVIVLLPKTASKQENFSVGSSIDLYWTASFTVKCAGQISVWCHQVMFTVSIFYWRIYATTDSYIGHTCGERVGRISSTRQVNRKSYLLPYALRNPYTNLKSENSQDYAQKPQRNCTFMNSASVLPVRSHTKIPNLFKH